MTTVRYGTLSAWAEADIDLRSLPCRPAESHKDWTDRCAEENLRALSALSGEPVHVYVDLEMDYPLDPRLLATQRACRALVASGLLQVP